MHWGWVLTQNTDLKGRSDSTLRSAFSLSPDHTPEYWALEKSYLNHKKTGLISWLFLMETFKPQTAHQQCQNPKSSGPLVPPKKLLSIARPKVLMSRVPPNGDCHWFQKIRCKMLLFELCFRTCTQSSVLGKDWTPLRTMAGCCNLGPATHLEHSPALSPSFPHTSSQGTPAALSKSVLFSNWHLQKGPSAVLPWHKADECCG